MSYLSLGLGSQQVKTNVDTVNTTQSVKHIKTPLQSILDNQIRLGSIAGIDWLCGCLWSSDKQLSASSSVCTTLGPRGGELQSETEL